MLAKSLRYLMQLSGLKLKAMQMIQANKKDDELMEKIRKGPDLTFQKLIQQKSLTDGLYPA